MVEKSNKVNSGSWEIQHQCPQCGAPVTIEETDRLFLCPFCRVKLYLSTPDYLRYYLSPPDKAVKELIYIPYWRFKGIAFFYEALQIKETLIDATISATRCKYFPATLGLRPQTLQLKFAAPGMEGSFLGHDIPIEEAFISPTPDKTYIGETISLIYSPVFIKNETVHDAFTEKPLAMLSESEFNTFTGLMEKADWQTRYLATLCPDCGWNLEGERDSCVLFCKNCNSAWQSSGHGFEKLGFAAANDRKENMFYLPFWKIQVQIEGLELKSYADLIKLANLPKAIKDEWHDPGLCFWVPAFKVRPELFLRIGRSVTIAESHGSMEENLPKGFLHPVTLPVTEAGECLKLIIADIAINKKKVFPMLKTINVHVVEYLLVFLPFSLERDELYSPLLHLTINKNALKFGRNL